MNKACKILFALLLLALITRAHEFWIGLSQYKIAVGGKVAVQLYVGEDFTGEVWAARKTRTGKVLHYHNDTTSNITSRFTADSTPVTIDNLTGGTHMITMESTASYIEMKADKFNEYLAEDGLDNIATLRTTRNETAKDSRELYQRFAKTIFKAGRVNDSTYKKVTKLLLELVPQKNPYALTINQRLPVLVLFNGLPLQHYKIRTWNKNNGKLYKQTLQTDSKGLVQVNLQHPGEWMVSLVKMEENSEKDKADYTSYWGSLCFGM